MKNKKTVNFHEYFQLFLDKNFVLVLLLAVAAGFARRMCQAPLTSYGMSIAGVTGTILGLSITISKVTSMLGRPVSGFSFDMVGCKATLIFSFLAQGAAYALLSFANNSALWCLGKGIEGFCGAIQGGLIVALAVSIVGSSGRGLAICLMSAVPTLFQSFAPALSKYIFTATSYSRALLVGAAFYLIPALIGLFLDEKKIQLRKGGREKEKPQGTLPTTLPWYKKLSKGLLLPVLPICTMGLFANIAKDLNTNYIVQLGEETGIDVTGGIAMAGLLSFVLAIAIGIIIDSFGTTLVLYLGYGMLAAANLLYGFGSNQLAYTLAALLFSIGIAAYWPALQAMVFRLAGPGRQGAASSTLYLFLDVVAIVFGTVTGMLYDAFGLQNVFKVTGVIVLGAIVYFTLLKALWLDRYLAKKDAEASASDKGRADLPE